MESLGKELVKLDWRLEGVELAAVLPSVLVVGMRAVLPVELVYVLLVMVLVMVLVIVLFAKSQVLALVLVPVPVLALVLVLVMVLFAYEPGDIVGGGLGKA